MGYGVMFLRYGDVLQRFEMITDELWFILWCGAMWCGVVLLCAVVWNRMIFGDMVLCCVESNCPTNRCGLWCSVILCVVLYGMVSDRMAWYGTMLCYRGSGWPMR